MYWRENDCIPRFIEAVPQQVVQDLEDMVRKGCGPGIILPSVLDVDSGQARVHCESDPFFAYLNLTDDCSAQVVPLTGNPGMVNVTEFGNHVGRMPRLPKRFNRETQPSRVAVL